MFIQVSYYYQEKFKLNRELISALVLFLLVLSGCASNNIEKDYSLKKHPNDGLIVVSVTKDGGPGSLGYDVNFYISDANGDPFAHLIAFGSTEPWTKEGGLPIRGALTVLSAPEGTYKLSDWRIVGANVIIYPKYNPDPIEFVVKKGEITYIGNIHMHMITGKNIFGIYITGGGVPYIYDMYDRDIRLFVDKYPQFFSMPVLRRVLKQGIWARSHESTMQLNQVPVK